MHAVRRLNGTLQNKINILHCVLKAAKYEKQKSVYRRFN